MKLRSKCLSKPKIRAFLTIYPFLAATYQDEPFEVAHAITRVNANPDLGVWCYSTGNCNKKAKTDKETAGFVSLDLQNACHCFAGRFESSVIDEDTGQKVQLLEVADARMTYRVRQHQTIPKLEDLT